MSPQPDDVVNVAVDKVNGLLESFMGINDTELGKTPTHWHYTTPRLPTDHRILRSTRKYLMVLIIAIHCINAYQKTINDGMHFKWKKIATELNFIWPSLVSIYRCKSGEWNHHDLYIVAWNILKTLNFDLDKEVLFLGNRVLLFLEQKEH